MIYNISDISDFKKLLGQASQTIYLVCAGFYGDIVGKWFNKEQIEWENYYDNASLEDKNGKTVKGLSDIDDFKAVYIICSVYSYDEIHKQLLAAGIDECNILGFNDRRIFDQMVYELENPYKYTQHLKTINNIARFEERCFIIGNGPSLRLEDLEKIGQECSFGTNSIMRTFDLVKWRPTGYFIQDPNWEKTMGIESFKILLRECKYIFCSVKNSMFEYKDLGYKSMYFYYIRDGYNNGMPVFSENVAEYVGYASTTVYSMLQMAVYMGYKTIYLLGMDLGFAKEKKLDGTIKQHVAENAYPDFLKKDTDALGIYETDKIIMGYEVAKEYAEAHGVKIYNATRGGYLEVFERVDFDSLF